MRARSYDLTPGELAYARLLYVSGIATGRIAELVGHDESVLQQIRRQRRWERRTPYRLHAPIGCRRPVTVRCHACAARYGEELGKPRPCPQCGCFDRDSTDPAQLSFLGSAP
jgi:hypothetical protein